MHDRVKLLVDHPNRLEAFLAVIRAVRANDDVIVVRKHSLAERQPQPMFEPVSLILGRIDSNCIALTV